MDTRFLFSPFFYASSIFFFIIIISRLRNKKLRKLPPQPWKLPLVGHIHHLVGGQPHHVLKKLAQKLGPIFQLQLGEVSAIVISSPALAKEIMKTHDIAFATRPQQLSVEIMAYNYINIAFSPYGDYWRQMRKICVLELLSAKKVQSFRSIREQESWNLVESLGKNGSKNAINLSSMIFALVNQIISRVTIGSNCKDQAMLIELIEEAMILTGGFDVGDLFPSIKSLPLITSARKQLVKLHKKIDHILDSIILDHQQRRVGNHENEDLVDVLLRIKDDGDLQVPLSFDSVKAVILDMFGAGSETSAATIEWAMSNLIKNPRVMKKAQNEIRQALKGKTTIHEADIQELDYLRLVIKETLRMYPPAPLVLPRECRENCEIGGYHISVKTKVLINGWMIARDPDYWTDPESFIPERFADNMVGTNFEYLPFGAGRRTCPGMTMGLANVELPLAMLLYHFDWELPNGATSEDFDMSESFGTTLKRTNNLLLVPHPYNANH
jgi:cytochrome P450